MEQIQAGDHQDPGRSLQEQVEESIQPVLANFRTQLEQTVRQQLEQTARQDAQHASHNNQDSPTSSADQPELPDEVGPPGAQAGEPAPTNGPQSNQEQIQEAEPKDSADDSFDKSPSVLMKMLRLLEDEGQQWLVSLLQMGLDTLFSEAVRRAVQEQAEEGLQDLLREAFDALPDAADTQRARLQAEEEAQRILRETLDSLFAGSIRADLERAGDRAIQSLLTGDFEAARKNGEQAVQSLFHGILQILQDHWGRILRIVFRVLAEALQESVASTVKEKLSDISLAPGQEATEEAESVQEEFQQKSGELRERMQETLSTIRERVEEESEELQRRLSDGLKSGVKEGTSNQKLGKPPLGRPGPPPSGRPPSGHPPSVRPPSGPRR